MKKLCIRHATDRSDRVFVLDKEDDARTHQWIEVRLEDGQDDELIVAYATHALSIGWTPLEICNEISAGRF